MPISAILKLVEKFLLFLALLFFIATGGFAFFLKSYNDVAKRQALTSKIAGVTIQRRGSPWGTPTKIHLPTSTPTLAPTISEELIPTLVEIKELKILLGNLEIENQKIAVNVVMQYFDVNQIPTVGVRITGEPLQIPFADFSLQLQFPAKILPGSADDRFIFKNKEYQLKIFHQIKGREKEEARSLLFKIESDKIIISKETGLWEQDVDMAVDLLSDGNQIGEIVFFIE